MTSGAPRMGPVGSRCGRPASRGGRVRPGLAGNGEVATRARAPQARVRARRRRPPSQGGHGFSGPHHWNGFSGPRCWRRPGAPAALHPGGPVVGGLTHQQAHWHPPRAAPSPRERYLFVARTVLVRRENGSYNVDRARTWLRESGPGSDRQGQPPCRGVRQLRGSRPLIGWSLCRYVGVSAGGARIKVGAAAGWEAVVAAGGVLVGGRGGGVAHSSWGPGRTVGVIPTFSRPGRRR